jgi:hypothetical protein
MWCECDGFHWLEFTKSDACEQVHDREDMKDLSLTVMKYYSEKFRDRFVKLRKENEDEIYIGLS